MQYKSKTLAEITPKKVIPVLNEHNCYKLAKGSNTKHRHIIVLYFIDDSIAIYEIPPKCELRVLRNYVKTNSYESDEQFKYFHPELWEDLNK